MQKKEKIRESNYELMRIISMLFIILYHFIISTGGSLLNTTYGLTHEVICLISIVIIVHVNSFILVSGYFQYDKKFKMKKVLKLISMVWVYQLVIALGYHILKREPMDSITIIKLISPFSFDNVWFFVTYIALYLLSPYINILIKKLSKKEHKNLIILLTVMYSVIATITNQQTFPNSGFTIIHFIYLYIVGAYLNKYPITKEKLFKNFSKKKRIIIYLTTFFILGVANYLLYLLGNNILKISDNSTFTYISELLIKNAYYYQTPFVIIQSIAYFLFFGELNFKNKIINKISSCTFAVYIITETSYIGSRMYRLLKVSEWFINYGCLSILLALLFTMIVFIVCVIIELIRKLIFKYLTHLLKFIVNKYKLQTNN